jgi:hypothetical protein
MKKYSDFKIPIFRQPFVAKWKSIHLPWHDLRLLELPIVEERNSVIRNNAML